MIEMIEMMPTGYNTRCTQGNEVERVNGVSK